MVTHKELLDASKELLAIVSSEPPKDNATQVRISGIAATIRQAEKEMKEKTDVQKAAEHGYMRGDRDIPF